MNPPPSTRDSLKHGAGILSAVTPADSPHLDAEVLLRHTLGRTRASLYAHLDTPLTASQWQDYQALLARRVTGEPVAYMTGYREFMGLAFAVTPHVLIPRPDTEVLVEQAAALLRVIAGSVPLAADVGTGSGAIAVSLAGLCPAARIYALDVSPAALAVARGNAARLLGDHAPHIEFHTGSLLDSLPEPVGVIAANLPYIPTGDMATLPPTVKEFEPHLALDGGSDGLDIYRRLLAQSPVALCPGGAILMECDPAQVPALQDAARQLFPQAAITSLADLAGRLRVVQVQT